MPPAADAVMGGAVEHGGEVVVRDGSLKRPAPESFMDKIKRMMAQKSDLATISRDVVSSVQPVRSDKQVEKQIVAFEQIAREGFDGNGLNTLLKQSGKKTVHTNFGTGILTEKSASFNKFKDVSTGNFRIQFEPSLPRDPASHCTAIQVSSGLVPQTTGQTAIGVTYKVMTPEEFNDATRRPAPADNFAHGFVTRHEFRLQVNYTSSNELKSCQLNAMPTTSPAPAPLSITTDVLFQNPKLTKYGLIRMYGLEMPDESLLIVGSPRTLCRAISNLFVVVLPETSSAIEFNQKASSLVFNMPHDCFQNNVFEMLSLDSMATVASCFKWVKFMDWIKQAQQSSAVIYCLSFLTKIADLNQHNKTGLEQVFSNCQVQRELRLFQMSSIEVVQSASSTMEKSTKGKNKSPNKTLNLIWNSYQFGIKPKQSTTSHFFMTLREYLAHLDQHSAIATVISGTTVLSRDKKSITSVNSSWPPGPTGSVLALTNTAEACISLISWVGATDYKITEDLTKEFEKTTKSGGFVSTTTSLAAAAFTCFRLSTIPLQCVYPQQHCFSFSLCSHDVLLNMNIQFFSALKEFKFNDISTMNVLEETFENTKSPIHCKTDSNFVKFFLHFVFGVVVTHADCESEVNLYALCKRNLENLQASCVYTDESCSNDHKMIFSRYFLLSIMMTILRTIDVLLFIPRKVPLDCIKIERYNRSSPWYLLAVHNMRALGNNTDKKTPYPNEFYFAPVHVMFWLTIIGFRLDAEKAGQSTAQILEEVRALSAADLKNHAADFLKKMYEYRTSVLEEIHSRDKRGDEDFEEEMKWDDAVDLYQAPDNEDFNPTIVPTELGLKGAWLPPVDSNAPEQPSMPYKVVPDKELGNERPNVPALPAPSEPVAAGSAAPVAAAPAGAAGAAGAAGSAAPASDSV